MISESGIKLIYAVIFDKKIMAGASKDHTIVGCLNERMAYYETTVADVRSIVKYIRKRSVLDRFFSKALSLYKEVTTESNGRRFN